MLKKSFYSSVAMVAALTCVTAAQASDGEIEFTGSLVGNTCVINGGNSKLAVNMPPIPASTLKDAGSSAGRTSFSISLTNCEPNAGNVRTYFEPGVMVNSQSSQLKVDGGGAENVELRLLNEDHGKINVGAAGDQNAKLVAIVAGSATMNYFVEYTSPNGDATAGAANSRVNYTLIYE